MIRVLARASALLALIVAWGLAAGDRPTVSLLSQAHAAEPQSRGGTYDLAALSVFNRVVLLVKENYFDPKRIDPKGMLVDSLDYVEKSVPEVLVDGDAKLGRVKVTVGAAAKDFEISDIDSIFKMSMRLHQIMGFVQSNLAPGKKPDDIREIEYALVNGMLSSLDPHSVLLKPEYFKEMKLSTKGEFGGLGFVISMKEGELTVVKVLKGTQSNPTPALKAGIKAKDKIVRIEDESTVNMELNSAVERLRGKPGSKVTITVARQGWSEPKQMTLARAKIEIESVESRLLANRIGYVRIKNFQGNTSRDLVTALRELRGQAGGKLAGVVLDLRGNPGGLLEQAIQVSDVFLDSGTIVTTVGMSDKLREVKRAHEDDTERDLPLAVLVNNGSASASEIVSGALKNLDRAVVVGRTTFGKGSVQVLYDFPDESALKLTIAQYLTPGDLSIQETGITPDVELIPSKVTKDAVSVFAPPKSMREEDLDHHLTNPGDVLAKGQIDGKQSSRDKPKERPLLSLRYLREEKEKKEGDEDAEEEEVSDEFVEDFQIKFARDLLVAAPFTSRAKIVNAMGGFVAERTSAEEQRISQAIQALGIDWADGQATGAQLAATISPAPAMKVAAGEKLQLTVEVENRGSAPVRRLHAWTECESNPLLDRREFLFGSLAPGQKKTWTVPIELPKDLASRRDAILVKFEDASGARTEDLRGEVNVAELKKPQFAFTYQVLDDRAGDGDGMPDPGEKLTIAVDVQNVGAGPSTEVTFGSIKNEADEKVFIEKGRYKLGVIKPGEIAHGTFELELKKGYKGATMPVRISVFDEKLEELVAEKLEIPVDQGTYASTPAKGSIRAAADLEIRAAPTSDSPLLALVRKGGSLPVAGRVGDFTKVEWAKGRTGFISNQAAGPLLAAIRSGGAAAEPTMWRIPPRITLDVDTTTGGAAVDVDRYTLSGLVEDPQLRDLYVFVNDQKVYFSPGGEGGAPVRFSADFPLKEGSNHIVVVAREGEELTSRRAFTVLRRKAAVAEQVKPGPPSTKTP